MLRAQLREKCELLESSKSNPSGDLESKDQDIKDLQDHVETLEADKIRLEATVTEIEQFRQELSKESNQHK